MKITIEMSVVDMGEVISSEEGRKRILDHQVRHPEEVVGHEVGRKIIERLLTQPCCEGIRLYRSLDAMANPALVYVGIDADHLTIAEYSLMDQQGVLTIHEGIVADRGRPGTRPDVWGLPE